MPDTNFVNLLDGVPVGPAGAYTVQTISEITARLGLVSATPGANTLLKRIQDEATDVADSKALLQSLVTNSESQIPVPVEQKGGRVTAWFTLVTHDGPLDSGDLVATDPLEIPNFFTSATELRKLTGIQIIDPSNFKIPLYVYAMDSNQSMGTVDNPPSISAANMEKEAATIAVETTDYTTQAAACAKAQTGKEREQMVAAVSTSLWVNAAVRGAVTYGAINLRIRITSEPA